MDTHRPLIALLVVGAAFVLALALFGSGAETVAGSTTSTFADLDIPDPPLPSTTVPRADVSAPAGVVVHDLSDEPVIPGLTGTLVTVVGRRRVGHSLVTVDTSSWERGTTTLPPVVLDFSLDASGQVLSYLVGPRGTRGRWVRSLADPATPTQVRGGRDAFVWSADEPLTAAWLEPPPGGGQIRVVIGEFTGGGMTALVDAGSTTGSLGALNSDGIWLLTDDPRFPRTGFVDFRPRPGGTERRAAADMVIPPPSGDVALLARFDTVSWRWDFGLGYDPKVPLPHAPGDAGGRYGFAALSPDGERIAYIGTDRAEEPGTSWVEVWTTDEEGGTRLALPFRVWDVAWSHDGSFVVMPGTDDSGGHVALLLDPGTLVLHALRMDDWVQFAAVVGEV